MTLSLWDCTRKGALKGSGTNQPKISRFGILSILSCWHWKRSRRRRRLSLNFLYLPTDRSSKRSSVVIDPFLVTVINQGDWFLSQKRRLDIDTTPDKPGRKLSCFPPVL